MQRVRGTLKSKRRYRPLGSVGTAVVSTPISVSFLRARVAPPSTWTMSESLPDV
jgi:hypothetical protein